MVMIPATLGLADDEGGYSPNREWPPPSEPAARLRELAERMNELTDRMDVAAKKEYVWPPSLINKFVQCLKADRRAREILAELVKP